MSATKHTPGFALIALLFQLEQWNDAEGGCISLDALTTHPETDDDCTFKDLIQPAIAELAALTACRDALDALVDHAHKLQEFDVNLDVADGDFDPILEQAEEARIAAPWQEGNK